MSKSVLLTYISSRLALTSSKPEVLQAVSATFSEKEVALNSVPGSLRGKTNPSSHLNPERWKLY